MFHPQAKEGGGRRGVQKAYLDVDSLQDGTEPVKTLIDMPLERSGDGHRDGQSDEWSKLHQVLRVNAHEELVEQVTLTGRLKPLQQKVS